MTALDHSLQQGIVPVVRFEQIEEDFKLKGIDITDAEKSSRHFDRWHKAKNLPTYDEEGKHKNSSKIFMELYQNDPEGEALCPPYVNVWHWLLHTFEMIRWKETSSRRTKDVPLIAGAFKAPKDPDEEDLKNARKRLEDRLGISLDEEMWAASKKDIIQHPIRTRASIAIIEQIVERYGIEFEVEGKPRKVMIVHMEVGC